MRARRLKKMREEERRKEGSNDDSGDVINPDRGGQRSPVRGRLSRAMSTASSNRDNDMDYESDDEEHGSDEKPVDDYAESVELLTTMEPEHYYPLNLLPTTRAEESRTQPALTIPEGTNIPLPFLTKKVLSKPMTESDLMQGNSTMVGGSSASGEVERLVSQNDGRLRGSTEEVDDQTMAMLHAGDSRNSGLYVRESPVWALKLLGTNEGVIEELRDSVDPNMHLARVTQRLLRDLQGSLNDLQVRETWKNMNADGFPTGKESSRHVRGMGAEQTIEAGGYDE